MCVFFKPQFKTRVTGAQALTGPSPQHADVRVVALGSVPAQGSRGAVNVMGKGVPQEPEVRSLLRRV